MEKRIGIDIDNCLTELDVILKKMAEYYEGPLMTIEDVKTFNISDIYGIPAEEAGEFWSTQEEWICENSILSEIRYEAILDNFYDEDTTVFIITSRGRQYEEATAKWLKQHGIDYDFLIMTNGESKKELIENLELDYMVDDKPDLFYEMEDSETKMICVDYTYNRGVPCYARMNLEGEITYVR